MKFIRFYLNFLLFASVSNGQVSATELLSHEKVMEQKISKDGAYALSLKLKPRGLRELQLIEVPTSTTVATFPVRWFKRMGFSPGGQYFYLSQQDEIRIRPRANPNVEWIKVPDKRNSVYDLEFTRDDRFVVLMQDSHDGPRWTLFELSTGRPLQSAVLPCLGFSFQSFFSDSGRYLVLGCLELQFLDLQKTPESFQKYPGSRRRKSVGFSSDEKMFALADGNLVSVYTVNDGKLTTVLPATAIGVDNDFLMPFQFSFSANSQYLTISRPKNERYLLDFSQQPLEIKKILGTTEH